MCCPLRAEDWTAPLGKGCHLLFLFLRKKTVKLHKALGLHVLSMFLNFEPLKPYVPIWFVLIKKTYGISLYKQIEGRGFASLVLSGIYS